MLRGYKVKVYPNKTQEQKLLQQIGSCRYVYNHFLALKKDTYLQTGENISYSTMSKELTKLRHEIAWMSEVQFQPLQQSLRSLDVAYNRFFRKQAKFPRFHKKNGNNSMRKVTGWSIQGKHISIMDGLTVRFRGTFPETRSGTLTISRDSTGTWWASTIGEEMRKQPKLKQSVVGVDVGLKDIAVTSNGDKYARIHVLDKFAKRIKSAAQTLSRRQKGSHRREQVRRVLARLHQKVGFIRSNYLHHVSTAIVSKNHAVIAIEDLAVANMMRKRSLSRSFGDAGLRELHRQLVYKQEWKGGKVVKINRFFPSSKTCSTCHFIVDTLPLSVREWTCENCGTMHDRDVNAAIMIAQQAGEQLGVERGDGSTRKRARVTRSVKRRCVQGQLCI